MVLYVNYILIKIIIKNNYFLKTEAHRVLVTCQGLNNLEREFELRPAWFQEPLSFAFYLLRTSEGNCPKVSIHVPGGT